MDKKPVLALVVPCYNEEEIIECVVEELSSLLSCLISEDVISENSFMSFVDDVSTDNSWQILNNLSQKNNFLKAMKLAYNAGHQNALLCGMVENDADIYITLDCDLQDDITIIPQMIQKYKNENVDIVYTVRTNRNTDSFFKKFFANMFYAVLPLFKINNLPNSADYRLVTNSVVKFLKSINEQGLYLRGLLQEYNFKYSIIKYTRKNRIGGKEKYSFIASFKLAINGILNSSLVPIRCVTIVGFIALIFSAIIKSLVLLSAALNLIALGIVGEYLGRTFTEVKKRPNYVVKDKTGN